MDDGIPLSLKPPNSKPASDCSTSPEFEFWMLRNPSFPQPNLLSADELFVDGILLPLHHLRLNHPPPSQPPPQTPVPSAPLTPDPPTLTASKRWKDKIFKKSDAHHLQHCNGKDEKKPKEKEKKKKGQGGGGATSAAAELNINIWPFRRSRSAGNNGTRPKMFPGASGTRKVSSAPCSRSNSGGESKSRKWPSSPGRGGGVHLGRSSPVWQVRRGGGGSSSGMKSNAEGVVRNGGDKSAGKREISENGRTRSSSGGDNARVLNLNVPTCIGYRHGHLSCRSDEVTVGRPGGGNGSSSGSGSVVNEHGHGGGNLFNLRSLFTRKVH